MTATDPYLVSCHARHGRRGTAAAAPRIDLFALALMSLLGTAPALLAAPGRTPEGKHWAVIVNGDDAAHHVRNAVDAHDALRANGFSDEHVFLLSSPPPAGDTKTPMPDTSDGPPSPRNLAAVLQRLRQEVTARDTLVVYITGHGGQSRKDPGSKYFIELVPCTRGMRARGPARVSLTEFVEGIESIRPRRGLLLFDQCYGQAFASALTPKGPFAAIALSARAEEVYCQNFSPMFWREIRRAGRFRRPLDQLSLRAAFDRAGRYARTTESAQEPILKAAPGLEPGKMFLWE